MSHEALFHVQLNSVAHLEEVWQHFQALGIYVKRLLQLYALFGQMSNDMAVHRLRQIQDPDLPVGQFNKAKVEQTLAAHPGWFNAGDVPMRIRNAALIDLTQGKCAANWEQKLFEHMQEHFHQYRPDAPNLLIAMRNLSILQGLSPADIHRRYKPFMRFGTYTSDSTSELAKDLRLASLVLVKRMHIDFQVVMTLRALKTNIAYPLEKLTPWLAFSFDLLARHPDLVGERESYFLLIHTAVACVLAGTAKADDFEACDWLELAVEASICLQNQQLDTALRFFDAAQKAYRSFSGKRHLLPSIFAVLYFIALYAKDDPAAWKVISAMLKVRSDTHELSAVALLQRHGESTLTPELGFDTTFQAAATPIDLFTQALLMRWRNPEPFSEPITKALSEAAQCAALQGLSWFAQQFEALVAPDCPPSTLLALKTPVAPWEDFLKVLDETENARPLAVRTEQSARLQVFLLAPKFSNCTVCLGEQRKLSAAATKINAALNLANASETKLFKTRTGLKNALAKITDEQDLRIANACFRDPYYLGQSDTSGIPGLRAFWADLIDHPEVYFTEDELFKQSIYQNVFVPNASQRVAVKLGQIQLNVVASSSPASANVEVSPKVRLLQSNFGISVQDGVLSVIDIAPTQRRLLAMLEKPLNMPTHALPQLALMASRESAPVRIQMDQASDAPAQAGDTHIHVLLNPYQNGLDVQVRVRPFGAEVGPYFVPGEGSRSVVGVIDQQIRTANRDLKAESKGLQDLIVAVPQLEQAMSAEGLLAEPEAALDLLAALQSSANGSSLAPILAWPKGKAKRVLTAQKFNITSTSGRDWLGLEGELELDEGSVKLSELIALLENSRGRYLTLDADRVIQISDSLRQRVQAMARFSDARGKVQVPLLAGAVLMDALGLHELVGADQKKLTVMNTKMARAFSLEPELPATLQAELRDYQISGYRWLMQMAHWGAGACLADDMGLGKTIQSLALLLARAQEGPAMVIAPTSVVGNWQREAARFAPTLNVMRFDALDRSTPLPELAPFDLLLVSYGLLSTHAENLAKVRFHTLIVDEAQAIKNASTQRAQAACTLDANFRVATTGTPIENNLGELWSLMNFLNPGLLSAQEKFQRRFAGPIERDGDPAAKSALRALVAPFLLRRTKAQVLTELPPKTEITLTITPSADEVALIAAMRATAIAKLGQMSGAPNEQRFNILAEITRLRRGACHPDLVAPELKIPSAKLAQLLELVAELKENRHRALIFSQFVDYLNIVRSAFDVGGISYQYLDGSTTSKNRDLAVAAFQAGQSDVFLLSLKAGGVGLNLTAADYVIHLDPWWNPAVEQQASDRAHRIGQTRPVTIYRLVLQGSIEEQILALHGQKRELIDSMLSERETAKPVSADELLALITGD